MEIAISESGLNMLGDNYVRFVCYSVRNARGFCHTGGAVNGSDIVPRTNAGSYEAGFQIPFADVNL